MRAIVPMLLLAAAPLAAKERPLPGPPPVPRVLESKCAAPEYHSFDFWVGEWDVFRTGTNDLAAVSVIEKLYGDCAIRENWFPFSQINGGSLTNYDPAAKAWRQTWVDASNARVDFSGAFADGRMVMTGLWRDMGGPGKDRTSRMTFFAQKDGTVRQIGEVSDDQGKTWAPDFDFTYYRKQAK